MSMLKKLKFHQIITIMLVPLLIVGMSGFTSVATAQSNNQESSENSYVVVPNDTMWKIAIHHGVTLTALINANPHIANPNLIFPGQSLTIPDPDDPPPPPDDIIPVTGPGESLYVVMPGDTLLKIAVKFDTTLTDLIQRNPHIVNPDLIFPGQRVVVPEEDLEEPDPTPTPPDEVIYQDDFSIPGLWLTVEDPYFWIRYRDDGYQVYNDYFNSYVNSVRSFNFSDIHVEVDAMRVAGPQSGYYGVVCRWQDVDNFYALGIGSAGFLTIARIQHGVVHFLTYGQAEGGEMNIGTGELNRIGGSCVDETLTLFVNDEPMLQVQDQAFSSGFVGVMTGTRNASGLQVHFDNFALLTPSEN